MTQKYKNVRKKFHPRAILSKTNPVLTLLGL